MKDDADSDDVLSAAKAAKLLSVPRRHVLTLIDGGVLPLHHRTEEGPYVRKSDVLAYCEQYQRKARGKLDSPVDGLDDLVKSGAMLTEEMFRERLGVSDARMAAMVSDGRIFALEADGERGFPAILCNSALRLERLWKIGRIIAPAPPALRLDFLTQACAALEDRVPVGMLDDDSDYKQLRAYAKAWASEFSRTLVVVWDAAALDVSRAKPLYTCAAAIDPRRPIWRRALNAIRSPGFTHPVEAPQAPSELVIVVERATAGQRDAVPEAGFVCHLHGRLLRTTVHASDGAEIARELELATEWPSVVDVADALFTLLAKVSRSADLPTGKVPTKKGPVDGLKKTFPRRRQKG